MTENSVACLPAGHVCEISAPVGQRVRVGDPILIVQVGADQVIVDAPVGGQVKRVFFGQGDALPEAAVVAVIEN